MISDGRISTDLNNDLLKDETHMLSAGHHDDNKDNILAMEEIIEEDSEDTEGRETTQTDTDESGDEMRQAADYVEHVEVSSRLLVWAKGVHCPWALQRNIVSTIFGIILGAICYVFLFFFT